MKIIAERLARHIFNMTENRQIKNLAKVSRYMVFAIYGQHEWLTGAFFFYFVANMVFLLWSL